MSDQATLMEQATQCYRSGQWDATAGLCRQVLELDPRHAGAHHLLGYAELRVRRLSAAVEHLEQAATLEPTVAQYQQDLSMALRTAGRFEPAVEHARQSVCLAPLRAIGYVELGNALRDAGQLTESEASFRNALRFDAHNLPALSNLAGVLVLQKRSEEAVQCSQQAARLSPDSPAVHFNLAECLQLLGRTDEAVDAYRQAITCFPEFAEAHHKLGTLLTSQADNEQAAIHLRRAADLAPSNVSFQLAAALAATSAKDDLEQVQTYYRRVTELNPNDVAAMHNMSAILVNILMVRQRFAEAVPYIEQNIQAAPHEAQWYDCMATCLAELDKPAESLPFFEKAIARAPDNADTHFFHGQVLLTLGDFAAGWPEYMWRLKSPQYAYSHPGQHWDGEPLDGKSILVYAEGGIGDVFHFIRYVPMIEQRGGKVQLEVPKAIIPILKDSGFENVMAQGTLPKDPQRIQVSLMSLPKIFGAALGSMPTPIPYLAVDAARIAKWRDILAPTGPFRVGIHWLASIQPTLQKRTIPLEEFEPLSRIPGVSLISLQRDPKNPREHTTWPCNFPLVDLGRDLDRDGAFRDTAAVMKNLDLVVTCDTSIGHLAGAFGVPVWVALPFAAEWRWMLHRTDSPWYPTMRLFRQVELNYWKPLFAEIATQLAAEVALAGRSK